MKAKIIRNIQKAYHYERKSAMKFLIYYFKLVERRINQEREIGKETL